MRVLAFSNERTVGADPDIRWALARLQTDGLVAEYEVESPRSRISDVGVEGVERDALAAIERVRPEVIIFFHSGSCHFSEEGARAMRAASHGAAWLYHEGDPFAPWRLPYHRHALPAVRRCDVALVFCDGYLTRLLHRVGVESVMYTPLWVNYERFPKVWTSGGVRDYDVVFIGNNVRSRVRSIPGARERARLVDLLQRRYGERAAIFGAGWSGPGVRGRCSFSEIPGIYARSGVAIGVDHTVGAYQFSDRPLIALASGIPLAHSSFEGRSEIFSGLDERQFFDQVDDFAEAVDMLLGLTQAESDSLSARERQIAIASFGCDVVMEFMLEVAARVLAGEDVRLLDNPWLGAGGILGARVS